MNTFKQICRIIIGLIFIFSGLAKGIDPLGSMYKITEYFNEAFHIGWAVPFAFSLGILFSTIEFITGLCLLLGVRVKLTAWLALLFMAFFTPLTLYSAITNAVTDCGCFGDAVKLSNWGTFFKNIVIFIPTLVVFKSRKEYKKLFHSNTEWSMIILFIISGISISLYSLNHLPFVDFSPYKVGVHVPDEMKIPQGGKFVFDGKKNIFASHDTTTSIKAHYSVDDNSVSFNFPVKASFIINIYNSKNELIKSVTTDKDKQYVLSLKTLKNDDFTLDVNVKPDKFEVYYTLVNAKSKESKKLSSEDYIKTNIWKDTTWVIKETSAPKLLEAGYQPPIHDFVFTDSLGVDQTETMLSDTTYTLLVVSYKLNKTNAIAFKDLEEFLAKAKKKHAKLKCYIATSSSKEDIAKLKAETGITVPVYTADETMLKTVIRANPGIVLLKQGTIIAKWHHNDLPMFNRFEQTYLKK